MISDKKKQRVPSYHLSLITYHGNEEVAAEALGRVEPGARAGEWVHTENSYKYSLDELSALAADTGFAREHTWLDPTERFSSNLFVARNDER